jgi:hypothetical protein
METELKPRHSNRKSFYEKAWIINKEDRLTLRSYQTEVAHIKEGVAYVQGNYSPTTTCHVKEFLLQNGFEVETRNINRDYPPLKEDKPEEDTALGGMFKALSMVCAVGQLECKTLKEQNAWDLRMLKASGLPLDFPADFDSLPEEEKARRLAGVKEVMAEDQKAVI